MGGEVFFGGPSARSRCYSSPNAAASTRVAGGPTYSNPAVSRVVLPALAIRTSPRPPPCRTVSPGRRRRCHKGEAQRCRRSEGWPHVLRYGRPVAANNDAIFRRLATVMGHPEWGTDPRYAAQRARGQRGDEIDGLVADWTSKRSAGRRRCRTRPSPAERRWREWPPSAATPRPRPARGFRRASRRCRRPTCHASCSPSPPWRGSAASS